jgi:glycosyltransferase involved in cell wall biosynthesis
MAVHVGNPANFRIAVMLKQMVEHVFYASTIDTCLFACSNHVLKSLKVHPYYRQFKATVSYNPVQLLEHNPYQLRKISAASEVIIGMTARLDPIKDHRTLLLAFKNVLNHYPLARLWLIGDGVLKNELELLALQINIAQQVTFWGNVADVYEKLMQMDIFVYSTTPREGLGNAVSEAMACGLPCIVSDLPMMHELVGTPPSALLFEPSDVSDLTTKLLQLLTDEQLRNNLSKQAFQRAISNFNASRYVTERMRFIFNSNN